MSALPTMLLAGVLIGRWWAVPVGVIATPLLVALSVPLPASDLLVSAALGAANVAVGLAFRWAAASLARLAIRLMTLVRTA